MASRGLVFARQLMARGGLALLVLDEVNVAPAWTCSRPRMSWMLSAINPRDWKSYIPVVARLRRLWNPPISSPRWQTANITMPMAF